MARILGISAFYHDSAAAVVVNGRIIAAAQEERFTRIKQTAEFPVNAISYCLQEAGITADDLDAVVFYDKPLLKFERLLQTYNAFAPAGLLSFLKSVPVWLKDKLFLKKLIREGLRECGATSPQHLRLLFTEHHLSHAASAFYPSSFEEAAILTIDGVGEYATASIGIGTDKGIEILRELHFPHSVGLLYSAFTSFLGFKVNSGEYKLMGLAPYGNECAETEKFRKLITSELISICDDGSVWLNQKYFRYATALVMYQRGNWERLFGFPPRLKDEELRQQHCNLALAIQQVTEEIILKMAVETARITGMKNICLAGGVALNCVANGKLQKSGLFEDIYIQPAAGDAGGALGAALAASRIYYDEQPETELEEYDGMKGSFLGPGIDETEIQQLADVHKAVFARFDNEAELNRKIAAELASGKIVGLARGRTEFGPRALGNRSILADPRNAEMQKKVNLSIKFREGYRPFAPAVLEDKVAEYFELSVASPYMLLVAGVNEKYRKPKPVGFDKLNMAEKQRVALSDFPAITHVDYSARIQTVSKQSNPQFHNLLEAFNDLTGCPMLLNTSFNVRGEPPVCSASDAFLAFMATDMDWLLIENCLFEKTRQPEFDVKSKWQRKFEED